MASVDPARSSTLAVFSQGLTNRRTSVSSAARAPDRVPKRRTFRRHRSRSTGPGPPPGPLWLGRLGRRPPTRPGRTSRSGWLRPRSPTGPPEGCHLATSSSTLTSSALQCGATPRRCGRAKRGAQIGDLCQSFGMLTVLVEPLGGVLRVDPQLLRPAPLLPRPRGPGRAPSPLHARLPRRPATRPWWSTCRCRPVRPTRRACGPRWRSAPLRGPDRWKGDGSGRAGCLT